MNCNTQEAHPLTEHFSCQTVTQSPWNATRPTALPRGAPLVSHHRKTLTSLGWIWSMLQVKRAHLAAALSCTRRGNPGRGVTWCRPSQSVCTGPQQNNTTWQRCGRMYGFEKVFQETLNCAFARRIWTCNEHVKNVFPSCYCHHIKKLCLCICCTWNHFIKLKMHNFLSMLCLRRVHAQNWRWE